VPGDVPTSREILRSWISGFGLRGAAHSDSKTAACQIAHAHAYRGESDRAFEWLERAYDERGIGLAWSKTHPLLRNVHGDPRWRPFLEKMAVTLFTVTTAAHATRREAPRNRLRPGHGPLAPTQVLASFSVVPVSGPGGVYRAVLRLIFDGR